MFQHALIATLALASVAGVASAQTSPTPSPSPSASASAMYATRVTPSPFMSMDMVGRYANQNFTDQARMKATPVEWRRANQAAQLINNQQCANAYTLALIELDDRLANNIKRVCRELAQQ
jgi:hypothetical protein